MFSQVQGNGGREPGGLDSPLLPVVEILQVPHETQVAAVYHSEKSNIQVVICLQTQINYDLKVHLTSYKREKVYLNSLHNKEVHK